MAREAFKLWLARQPFKGTTRSTQWAHANRIEKHYGDLDTAYDNDGLEAFRSALNYSKEDERKGRPDPSKFGIDGDVYSNLAGYRATLTYYARFREGEKAAPEGSLKELPINMDALKGLKNKFLARYPDFVHLTFQANNGSYWKDEREYKDIVIARASELLDKHFDSDDARGQGMLDCLQQPPANFIGWRTFAQIKDGGAASAQKIAAALGEMLTDQDDAATVAATCAAKIQPVISGGALDNPSFGQVRSLVTTAMALIRPDEAIAVKTRYMQRAAKELLGHRPIRPAVMTATEYQEILALAGTIFVIMRDEWAWAPKDLWDVQGFLWVTSDLYQGEPIQEDEDQIVAENPSARPTNLILYGPPGTGKTYESAARAVRLCDGAAPKDRVSLMNRYRDLVARKRISFVTFHQSYAYEDFVEGLRPESDNGVEDGGTASPGFSLRPQAGIFRKIAQLARDNHGTPIAAASPIIRQQVFKMSLGRSAEEEGTRLFRESIDGGYVVLGYGGEIDWSPAEYSDFGAIKRMWQKDHPQATGNDPNIQQIYALRGGMKNGDLVVISDGNKKFRAIGEIMGDYKFVMSESRDFNHRRPVRWLWQNDEGLPRELIYSKGFSQVSVYQLDSSHVNWPALEQIVAGSSANREVSGKPEPYVLIIDEINRANVSKVFGELITLIEPDKRLDAENELTVVLPYSGDVFGVPSNLHIVGTMNTADRSIALLDTALRRRFEFEELMPEPALLQDASEATGVDLISVLSGLNNRIEYLFDREHQIGHAFFMTCTSLTDLSRVMRTKIIPLLAEYFYEDWEKVRQVLCEKQSDGAFIKRTKLPPTTTDASDQSEEGRWRYTVLSEYPLSAYQQLIV